MKFVDPPDSATVARLRLLVKESPSARVRQRAHAVLLSAKRYRIDTIADIFEVDRDTVSRWLENWEKHQFNGLEDEPRSGRPRKLSSEEEDQALQFALEEPRQLKTGLIKIREELKVSLSLDWLRDLLHRRGYAYKRIRASLKQRRNRALFDQAQADLRSLQQKEDRGLIDLYYFDESGFALRPVLPYAWQAIGQRIEVEHTGGKALNVLGFLRRDMSFTPYVTETNINSETVIACMNHFAQNLTRDTVVVIDNAPAHTSAAFQAMIPIWKEQGLSFYFLPSYCPALNLIELLWKQIKYYWIPLSAYLGWNQLRQALDQILVNIGSKYRITFA